MPVQRQLACRRIGSCQPAVGSTPDASDTASSANEQRCRCETHKSQQQCVLDQVLTLFVLDEIVKKRRHVYPPWDNVLDVPFIIGLHG